MKTGRVMQVRSAIVIATWCLLPLPHFANECTAQEAQATETPQSEHVVDETIQLQTILERAGVTPVRTIEFENASIAISNPFALDGSHQIAVAWVNAGGEQGTRMLYRSNSQCSWRMCDATTKSHIGKGFHEFDKQVPIDVTVALLRLSSDCGTLRPWEDAPQDSPSQFDLAGRLLRRLTEDRETGIRSGTVLSGSGGSYMTREYASLIPAVPRPFSIVHKHLLTVSGGKVADPDHTKLPPQSQLPDFRTCEADCNFRIPSFGKFANCSDELTGKVFRSRNGRIRYFFVEDQRQRTMLACVEPVDAPICSLGLRTQYLDVAGMDTPLVEYGAQIPEAFGGRRKARYQLNWNWVRRLPIIEYFYQQQRRQIPPPESPDGEDSLGCRQPSKTGILWLSTTDRGPIPFV